VPPDRIGEDRKFLEEALASELVIHESIRRRRDGSLIYVDVSTKAIRDSHGRVEYILSHKKDVTHLKALRDAKQVEAKFRDLLESTPDAIVIANLTGRIVLANTQAEKVFGYQRKELLGKPVELLLPERFRGSHLGHRANYFAQPRTRSHGRGFAALRSESRRNRIPRGNQPEPSRNRRRRPGDERHPGHQCPKTREEKFRGLLESAPDAIVRSIPFVLLTSSRTDTSDGVQERAIALGADSFLSRPIPPEQLLQEIETCLTRRKTLEQ
jgi:PAS domain S-box-containing protein